MKEQGVSREECEAIINRGYVTEMRLARYCLALLDECENLRRDKERLDWLEKNLALQISHVKLDKDLTQIGVEIIFGPTGAMVEQDTLREAIDAAISENAANAAEHCKICGWPLAASRDLGCVEG